MSLPTLAAFGVAALLTACSGDDDSGTLVERDAAVDQSTKPATDGGKSDAAVKADASAADGTVPETGTPDTGAKDSGADTSRADTGIADAGSDARDSATGDSGGDATSGDAGGDAAIIDAAILDASLDTGATLDAGDAAGAAPGYYFGTDLEGFAINFKSPTALAATAEHDGTTGYGGNGSVKLDIAFNGANQKAALSKFLGSFQDLRTKMLHARIRVDSGLKQTAPFGGAKLYVKSADANSASTYHYAENGWVDLDPAGGTNGWIELTVNISAPTGYTEVGYDGQYIREIGIEIDTPGNGAGVTAAVLHIDAISID